MTSNIWQGLSDRRRLYLLLALVAVSAVIPYVNSLWNDFAYDDVLIIQFNQRVHDWRAWRDIWLTPYWPALGRELGLYRPLAVFLYALQWAASGGEPWFFHLNNILLHAGVCILLFLLLAELTGRVPALLGTLVFAVHPVHTEAVANVVGQAELVAAAAVLGGCLVHAARPPGPAVSYARAAALALLYAVGLLTKESAVVLPGLLVLVDLMQRRVTLTTAGLRAWVERIVFPMFLLVAVLCAYLLLRFDALGGTLTGVDAGPTFPYLKEHRLLNAFRAFPEYLRLLFWPADLTIDYAPATIFPVERLTLMSAIGALLLAGLTLLAAATPWRTVIGAAPAWFLISLSPVSNIFFPIGVLLAERTLYLPSVAVAILVANGAAGASFDEWRWRRIATPAFVAAVVALGLRTWIRNPDWKTTATVQISLIRDHPENYHGQWMRAMSLWVKGRLRGADLWFLYALRTYDGDGGMLTTYGAFLAATGRDGQALPVIERIHASHPYVRNTTVLLAYLYLTNRRFDSALTLINRAEALDVPSVVTMPLRAYVYQGMGRPDMAVRAWRATAAGAAPGTAWLARAYEARTLAFASRPGDAAAVLQDALAQDTPPEAADLLRRVADAIRAGCYQTLDPASISDLYQGTKAPSCDPLGSWFNRKESGQGAIMSQFAIPRRLPTDDFQRAE